MPGGRGVFEDLAKALNHDNPDAVVEFTKAWIDAAPPNNYVFVGSLPTYADALDMCKEPDKFMDVVDYALSKGAVKGDYEN